MSSTTNSPETAAPLNRREANVAARRQRILESARSLLAQAGQDGLSMRRLAKEADLSVTTLYNLVGSREDILRALIEDSAEHFESTVTVPESIGDSLARTMKAFDSVLDHLVADAAVLQPLIVANIATGYGEELRKEEHGLFLRGARNTVRQCLLDALAEGQIRDVVSLEFLEGQFYASLELALDRWAFGLVDEDELRVKGLWGAYLTLLAVASPENRPQLENELQKLERLSRKAIRSRKKRRSAKPPTGSQPGVHSWKS
jgi:AcrR family transcriptional regulator